MIGKTVWIVGATSGLGYATAMQLADNHQVIVSGRNSAALDKMAVHPNIHAIVMDTTDEEQIKRAVGQIEDQFEDLDCVIYSAGVCHYIDIEHFELETVRQVYEVNVFGSLNLAKHVMPLLKKYHQKNPDSRPLFAPIASLSTKVPFSRAQAYGSSKAAMTYWFEALRVDCHDWLDVTIVNPGFIKTPMIAQNDFSMPGLMTPEDAANRLIKGLNKRPLTLDFPKRLAWTLSFFATFKTLWCRVVGPQLARADRANKSK
jgi:NAD(P)-dependent dehydrogenase (short-subunit alcohol dehydrogenase family)